MSKKEFDTCIDLEAVDRLTLSEHDNGLWLSVWKIGSHCSANLTREQVAELRDALTTFLSLE